MDTVTALDFGAIANAVAAVIGGGPVAWIASGVITVVVMGLIWWFQDWIKSLTFKQSQQDVPSTEDDVKNKDVTVTHDVDNSETNTNAVVADNPDDNKPHRPVPPTTDGVS